MRPRMVVIIELGADDRLGVIEPEEQGLVQQFVARAPVETLAKAVLRGLAECDVMPIDMMLFAPDEYCIRDEFRPMIRRDHSGLAATNDQRCQLTSDRLTRDRRVRDRRQAFARHVVDDVQDAEAPTAGELIVDKIERPARIRLLLDENRRSRAYRAAASAALAHAQALLAIEPVNAIDARRLALLQQQNKQPSVAKTATSIGQIAKLCPKLGVGRPSRAITDGLAVDSDNGTGPTFRQAYDGQKVGDGFALADQSTQSAQA